MAVPHAVAAALGNPALVSRRRLLAVFINIFFVLFKGAKSSLMWKSDKAAWVAAIVGGAVFLLAVFPGIWLLKWTVKRDMDNHARTAAEAEAAKDRQPQDEEAATPEPSSKAMKVWNSLKKAATHGLEVNIHEVSGAYVPQGNVRTVPVVQARAPPTRYRSANPPPACAILACCSAGCCGCGLDSGRVSGRVWPRRAAAHCSRHNHGLPQR